MNQDNYATSTPADMRTWSDLPPGYTVVIGPHEQRYLIPTVMLSTSELELEAEKSKKELAVDSIVCNVSSMSFLRPSVEI
jgi:hypothetical protein